MKCLFSYIYIHDEDAPSIKKIISAATGFSQDSAFVVNNIIEASRKDASYGIRYPPFDTQKLKCFILTDDRSLPVEDEKEVARKASLSGVRVLTAQDEDNELGILFYEFLNGDFIKKFWTSKD